MPSKDAQYDAKLAADAKAKADAGVPKVGTVLRYKPGTKAGTQIAVYADGVGGEFEGEESSAPVVPGATGGERVLASETFKNTWGLLVGAKEASQPYVTKLYQMVSGYYKTGSTVDEALNLALYEAHNNNAIPEFTKRFQGIFDLQKKRQEGQAVLVPSVADFITTEAAMAENLTEIGLGDLATEEFLGGVIGRGKSLLEVTNLIKDVFDAIDNAPSALKADMQNFFPGVDRTSIARALLTGEKGAAELTKQVKEISVLSAANTQKVAGISTGQIADIAAMNYDYTQSLTGFGTVKELERGQTLAAFENGLFTTGEAVNSVFAKNAAAKERIRMLNEREVGRMSGSSGASKGAFSTGYINKQSEGGAY